MDNEPVSPEEVMIALVGTPEYYRRLLWKEYMSLVGKVILVTPYINICRNNRSVSETMTLKKPVACTVIDDWSTSGSVLNDDAVMIGEDYADMDWTVVPVDRKKHHTATTSYWIRAISIEMYTHKIYRFYKVVP